MKTLLTIAGFDPSSGAGATADLMVFAAHGFYGTSCITSLTVQSTKGVRSSHSVDASILEETLACLLDDLPPAGIKIGMLGTERAVTVVATFLEQFRKLIPSAPVVLDPILRASSGRNLLTPEAANRLRSELLPFVDWVTPNLDELGWMTQTVVTDRDGMMRSTAILQRQSEGLGQERISVLAKGGHLDPPNDLVLLSGGEKTWLSGKRIDTKATHGTGCALSSALLCRLVLGDESVQAARNAKAYVAEAMKRATPIGHGNGPMKHLWPLRPR